MADSYTEGLRREAPNWSLAGDKQLLDVLQGLHQKIIEKCQETNRNLEKMVTALDEASIHLQNVNNKFTALSNSQFIESRVYDDDTEEFTDTEKPKEEQEMKPNSELDELRRSLQVLDEFHETVTILCDSDSDVSDDDDDDMARMVLKPKDLYADRPLPYIIGTKAWKAKWHAGLLPDESDSDSASVKDGGEDEQYSDSDPDPVSESPQHMNKPRHSPTISSTSDLETEQESQHTPLPVPRSQCDVAAELARRLGTLPKLPDSEPAQTPPSPTVRKLYKPHQPTPGNVFLDEPPPLTADQSDESDDDIFAEINKKQPYNQSIKRESSVADDLFGRPIFDEVPPSFPSAKQNQSLFEDESEPELFANKQTPIQEPKREQDSAKKPVGGMSLFGSNANAESIGAAILKRNQRQSSTSGEDTDQDREIKNSTTKNKITEQDNTNILKINKERDVKEKSQKERERDIFEDLFAKSERINKEKNKISVKEDKRNKEQIKKEDRKADLFSDNIFDDIDDIFTTNVKVAPKDTKKEQKSIFDDDDLFADVKTDQNKENNKKVDSKNSKDIFIEEDNIFNDKLPEIKSETKVIKNKIIKETKSLFDDSDDDLFLEVDKTKTNKHVVISESSVVSDNKIHSNVEKGLFSDDDELFKDANTNTHSSDKQIIEENPKPDTNKGVSVNTSIEKPSKIIKSPDLFDDDDDDGMFLFKSTQSKSKPNNDNQNKTSYNADDNFEKKFVETKDVEERQDELKTVDQNEKIVVSKSKKATSSIFEDEDDQDDIFSKPETSKKENLTDFEDKKVSLNKNRRLVDNNEGETNVLSKTDQTIIETTVTTKPVTVQRVSEKPVTVISTKITVNPNTETESVISQDVTTVDNTVIDTKITVTPDTNETIVTSDITAKEAKVTIKPDIAQKPIVAKTKPEELPVKNNITNVLDNMKEVDANKNVTESIFDDFNTENELSSKKEENIETKTDVFSDIFNDLPPVFEKPKEPKRSKNVNALFDDDSDDESLFFKKNDVTSDERPEGFISNDERLFGLFRDEPPAIDVDFVQKSNKPDRLSKLDENIVHDKSNKDTLFSQIDETSIKLDEANCGDGKFNDKPIKTDHDDEIFGKVDKNIDSKLKNNDMPSDDTTTQPIVDNVDRDPNKNLFGNITEDIFGRPSVEDDAIFKIPKVNNDLFKEEKSISSKNNIADNSEIEDESNKATIETKKIGKLKPMNFNINVNTLLPGASPKKIAKDNDDTDGQTPSKSNDDVQANDNKIKDEFETKLVKSINFVGNPDSPVLDNKLSKERAKIQVKRRPSTRRARREAVKKSGIDFGEDSTDNSSSIDDQPKIEKSLYTQQVANTIEPVESQKDTIPSEIDIVIPNIEHDITDAISNKANVTENINKEQTLKSTEKSCFGSDDDLSNFDDVVIETNDATNEQQDEQKVIETVIPTDVKEVKSKVVYILNDEDIFNTKTDHSKPPKPNQIEDNTKTERVFDDPDDLFKSTAKDYSKTDGITTLGQVYKETKNKTTKLDFLSDSDDDNLFKTSTTDKEATTVKHKPIKEVIVRKKKPDTKFSEVEVKNVTLTSKNKKSPFEDVDGNLFKQKNSKREGNVKKSTLFGSDSDEELFSGLKKEKEVIKKQESKKEENRKEIKKGSLFEEDDDDDLFGVKTKKTADTNPLNTKMAAKEVSSKPAEPVFEDPLSLLGSGDE